MRAVVLDANALLMPFQFRINLEAELRRLLGDIEVMIPAPVLDEVRGLTQSTREARAALQLASGFRILEADGPADDAVLRCAKQHAAVVVTNDAALLRTLKSERIPRVFLRSRSHLVLEGL